ncbi:MAG: choice-of-anchor B family protein [Calditrichia bacterium]
MSILRYAAFLVLLSTMLLAQGNNMSLLANVDDHSSQGYTDVWGYEAPDGREYALLGVNGGVSIIDVTDAVNSAEVAFVPWVNFGWYDMKTFGTFCYVTTEGSSDLLVIDLVDLPNSATIVDSLPLFTTNPHNNFVDTQSGLLYGIEDFNFNTPVRVFSLAFPQNPFEISTLSSPLGIDAHDVFAKDSILYVAEGSSPTIGIFDMHDPVNPALLQRVNVPAGGYVHNVWVSEDNTIMATTEETAGKTVKVWDIADLNNISLVGEYLGESELAHNVFIQNDYMIMSHYESGIKLVDISDPARPTEVGSYDSYPQGDSPNFNGAWGLYPFGLDNKLYIGDIQTGLYVVEYEEKRAGFVDGTITDATSAMPIPDVNVRFLESGKTTVGDANGVYGIGLAEGIQSVEFSKIGYFADTLMVTVTAGNTVILDAALNANLADIGTSSDSLAISLPADTTVSLDFVVSNDGPSGILQYSIRDINGPLFLQPELPDLSHTASRIIANDYISSFPEVTQTSNGISSAVGDTIFTDPAGDLVFGSGGDIIAAFATVNTTDITLEFEFLNTPDPDSAYLLLSLDTDFNVNTGAFPGGFGFNLQAQNVGAEYDILLNLPAFPATGAPANSFSIWVGDNGTPSSAPLFTGNVSTSGNIVSFTLPLSIINDDGNLAIAGFGGNLNPAVGNISSQDFLPDVGNGAVGIDPQGDLPWLSLSQDSGTLLAGETDTISVTFDTNGLIQGEQLEGVLELVTNDPDETLFGIPVELTIGGVVGIDLEPLFPTKFVLSENYPNPFNPTTRITYQLPVRASVDIAIYNLLGQKIRTLASGIQPSGRYELEWDGRDESGYQVASSVYFYRMVAINPAENAGAIFTDTRKMVLMR